MTSARTARRTWHGLLLAALLTLLLAPLARAADPVAITSGAGADWGVKTSFRNYIKGPIAHGSIAVGDGVTENADGTFHWPVSGGEYDPATNATVVRFGGFVRFTGHDGALDMRVWNPRVEITPEGADLYAEVISKPNIEGVPSQEYPNARLAALDPTGLEPDVAGGTTTWPALPATLTQEGVEPFAGFYGVDTVLDPIGFAYDGPGGTPIAEVWTAPGTDKLGALLSSRTAAGVAALALGWDDRLWLSNYDRRSVATVDGTTLETLRTADTGFNPRNIAVDRTRRVAYTVDNAIKRLTESAGALGVEATPLATLTGTASNELAVRQSDGSIFTIFDHALHRFSADGAAHDAWSFDDLGQPWWSRLTITDGGRLFLYGPGIAEVTFGAGGAPQFRTIVDSPYATNLAVADNGTIAWAEANYDNYPTVVRTLHVLRQRSDGGYEAPIDTPAPSLGFAASAISADGSRLFIADNTNNKVQVVEDGAVVATVEGDSAISVNSIVVRGDGNAYALWRDGSIKLIGRARSPTPTTQPQDAAVEVDAGGSARATFTAAASGTPAPAIAWQRRPAGSSRWLPAGSGETLTVVATEADAGTRYRAIFGNAAGSIASGVATLAVTVKEPTVDPGPGNGGGGGGGTTPPPSGGGQGPVTVDPPLPAPRAAAPRLTIPKAALTLTRTRRATIATVACAKGGAACTLTAPTRVVVKIGGKRSTATVTAPKRIAAGKRGVVRLRLTKAAAARLAGTRAVVSVRLTVASGGTKTARTVKVTLKGAAKKAAAR